MKISPSLALSTIVGVITIVALTNVLADEQTNKKFIDGTYFTLSLSNIRLMGGKFVIPSSRRTHLPYWFDFELFKSTFNKKYANEEEELKRHHEYIKTCIRTVRARVLFRILAATHDTFITKDADKLPDEKAIDTSRYNLAPMATTTTPSSDAADDLIRLELRFPPALDEDETPIQRAIRLMKVELDRLETRNELANYIMVFESEESPFSQS